MTTCWTGTGDSYGYSGVAFTTAGDVWTMNGIGAGTGPIRRVDFPGMSSVLETINFGDLTAFGGTHLDPHALVCVDTDPLVCAVDNDGHSILVNCATDTVIHDFGSLASNNRLINSGVYNATDDVLYFSFFGDSPAIEGVYVINPDGSGKSEVWSSSTANITANGKLVSASDDGVWWSTDDDVYRVSVTDGVDSLALTGQDNLLIHDPDDPERVLKYDFDDPERFTWSAGSISSDAPTCDDPFPTTTSWVGISQDGTKGLLVNQAGVVLYWGVLVQGWTVGRVAWGSRGGWH